MQNRLTAQPALDFNSFVAATTHVEPQRVQRMHFRTVTTLTALAGTGVFLFGFLVGDLTLPAPRTLGGVAVSWWLVLLVVTIALIAAVVNSRRVYRKAPGELQGLSRQEAPAVHRLPSAATIAPARESEPWDDMFPLTETVGTPAPPLDDILVIERLNRLDAWMAFQEALREAEHEAKKRLAAAFAQARRDEAKRCAREAARIRQELEDQHAQELQRAHGAALEAFQALALGFRKGVRRGQGRARR